MKLINNKITLAVCMALSLSACSPNKTADEYLASAKAHIASNENADALIELKNAVRMDLKNPEARLLLGSLYLDVGDAAAAEKELARALALNANIERALPKLLKALNLQEKTDDILALVAKHENAPTSILPEVYLYQALAYNRIGEKEKAKQAIEQASDISSQSVYSQLGGAYLKADAADIDGALATIEKILAKMPELTEALILKGQLLFIKQDYASAIKAFNEYHRLLPSDIKIRLFLANTYVKNEQFDEANKHLDVLLSIAPEHAFTNQLKGLIFYQEGDYKQALARTEKAIQNGLNTPSNRVVAGLSAFKLEQYEQAHQYLVTVAESLSSTHPVRRVLALVQMQLGYSDDAGETLTELEGVTAEDVNLFTSASFELLKQGKVKEAKALLAKTDGVITDNSQDMTKIGILKLSMNDLEGMADLEKAIEIDPELPMAKVALAAAYIQNKEFDKALALAETWKASHPKEVEGYNLTAKVLLLQGQTEQAEKELKQVLTVNENNPYSLLYFANKYLLNKQPEKAIEELDKIFSVAPDHLTALKLNYRAYKAMGKAKLATDKIEQSVNNNPNNPAYRLLFAQVLFIEKDFDKTIEQLKNIESDEDVPAIQWMLLGDSYLQSKQIAKALNIYDRWIKLQPQYRVAWLRKVSTQEKLADYSGALFTVEQLLEKSPKDSQFNILRAHYQILTKQFKDAQKQIDKLSEEQKILPLTQGLQAKIWLTEGRFKDALPGLIGLYKLMPSPYNAALVFATYKKINQDKVAFEFIQKHVKAFPNDMVSVNLLAESAINFDKQLAKKYYLEIINKTPNNVSVLNNLAWVEYQLANYKEADTFAARALKLDPTHPQILDTAGLIKLKLNDKKQGIKLLKQAVLLAPKDQEIAKHYQDAVAQ